jgi:hypothetical protein
MTCSAKILKIVGNLFIQWVEIFEKTAENTGIFMLATLILRMDKIRTKSGTLEAFLQMEQSDCLKKPKTQNEFGRYASWHTDAENWNEVSDKYLGTLCMIFNWVEFFSFLFFPFDVEDEDKPCQNYFFD